MRRTMRLRRNSRHQQHAPRATICHHQRIKAPIRWVREGARCHWCCVMEIRWHGLVMGAQDSGGRQRPGTNSDDEADGQFRPSLIW